MTSVFSYDPYRRIGVEGPIERLKQSNGYGERVVDPEPRGRIHDEHIKKFPNLTHLRHVGLGYSHITDESVADVCAGSHLEYLGLSFNAITDETIVHISRHPGLQHLTIIDTAISDNGTRRLRKALRSCRVIR
ncbi:MAG: hypothetical protein HOK71_19340 [Planctomycetaceae bacterium]|nr:hypothetical protein [Planctomycetaceae bacterium]MBT6486809.1 hypothetical protein [Planctomycetaceae bacterium]